MAARKPRRGTTKPQDTARKRRAAKRKPAATQKRRARARGAERDDAKHATDEETARDVATGPRDAQLQADMSLDDLEAQLEKPSGRSGPYGPVLSGGDVDAAWDDASGEETVGGSSPTPDQDEVDELGKAVGVTYSDTEPLHTTEKVERRDDARWELDPASADDYPARVEEEREAARRGRTAPRKRRDR